MNTKLINDKIIILLAYILFIGIGCQKLTPDDGIDVYAGKWELSWTNVQMDTIFVHKALLTLDNDKTFSSNTSFFIRRDSLLANPSKGRWNITILNDKSFTDGNNPNKIELTSGSFSQTWYIDGQSSSGYMHWSSGVINYSWSLLK